MTPRLLARLDEIDTGWVRAVLGHAGIAAEDVMLVAVAPIGHGTSSEVARLTLDYGAPAAGRPRSLIAKMPRRHGGGAAMAEALGYLREIAAYRFFGAAPACRIPRAYLAGADDGGHFNLILEDLGAGCRPGDQIAGCGEAEAWAVMRELAALHARYWRDPALATLGWPRRRAAGAPRNAQLYAAGATAMAAHADALGPEMMAVIEAVVPLAGPWNAVEPEALTLIHADPRVDNIVFEDRAEGVRACLIDLQSIAFWDAAFDLAYFLGGSVAPELRRRIERALVAEHAATLALAHPGFDTAGAWARYRQHAVCGLMGTVMAAALVDRSDHNDRLIVTLARRNCTAVIDLDGIAAAREWIGG